MKYILILSTLALTACATPITMLKNGQGQTVQCGGDKTMSIAFGRIGYEIQKANDAKCVEAQKANGFKEVK